MMSRRPVARLPYTAGLLLVVLSSTGAALAQSSGKVSGELKKWHRVTITFDGPETRETAEPNPFRDYRLAVVFLSGATEITVPGFYAADGDAAETGADRGSKWRVHFAPPAEGTWHYTASFRAGRRVAVTDDPRAGEPTAFDGAAGSFEVGPTDKSGLDLRGKGMLRYVGRHYLQFAETGDFFLKAGADSPENFLAYRDFDGTVDPSDVGRETRGEARRARLHAYEPHLRDFRDGDPTWRGGRGKAMIGALNYLAGQGVNSVYFLTMNAGGDGNDVWPWTGRDERFRFDCSKLDQWEVVFSHMDSRGILLHVVTQETENDQLLDGGALGDERKLYYRELVARFAHHPAVTWNLGEENTNTDEQRKAFSTFLHELDPYDHPVVVHTFPGRYDEVYNPLLGHEHLHGPSLQTNQTHRQTTRWVDRSAAAGHPWVVCLDEIGPANTGVKPDADDPEHDEVRKRHLWGNLMGGGAGVEWYFGYDFAHNDLNCEDFRSRQNMWRQTRIAVEFFHAHLPFERMRHAGALTGNPEDFCFARPGEVYAVYLPGGGTTDIDLGRMTYGFDVHWYNPREGGKLMRGTVNSIRGPGRQSIGRPPRDEDADWLALVRRRGDARTAGVDVENGIGGGDYTVGAALIVSAVTSSGDEVFSHWDAPASTVADARSATTSMIVPENGVTIRAVMKPAPPLAGITGFTLINAETNEPIESYDPLRDGATIRLSELPTRRLSIRANLSSDAAARIRFGLDEDTSYRTESVPPFSLGGDTDSNYNEVPLAPGRHTVTATLISAGRAGKAVRVRFTIEP